MKKIKEYLKKIYTYLHSHNITLLDCVIKSDNGEQYNAECKVCHKKYKVYFNPEGECFLIKE